jgi:hypothetical protein
MFNQPFPVLGEHGRHPHAIVHRPPDEPAKQQFVSDPLDQLPRGAHAVQQMTEKFSDWFGCPTHGQTNQKRAECMGTNKHAASTEDPGGCRASQWSVLKSYRLQQSLSRNVSDLCVRGPVQLVGSNCLAWICRNVHETFSPIGVVGHVDYQRNERDNPAVRMITDAPEMLTLKRSVRFKYATNCQCRLCRRQTKNCLQRRGLRGS